MFLHYSVPWAIRAERRSSHIIPSPVSPHASRKPMSKSAPPGLSRRKLPTSPAAALNDQHTPLIIAHRPAPLPALATLSIAPRPPTRRTRAHARYLLRPCPQVLRPQGMHQRCSTPKTLSN